MANSKNDSKSLTSYKSFYWIRGSKFFTKFLIGSGLMVLTACSSTGLNSGLTFGKTYAEEQAAFTYVPLEPTLVKLTCSSNETQCTNLKKVDLLDGLPDNSVRLATRKISGKGSLDIGFVGANVGIEGSTYDVIIDFVNTQTVNIQFEGYWQGFRRDKKTGKILSRLGEKKEKQELL